MKVTPPDIELWLTGHIRREAARAGTRVMVSNKEPPQLSVPLTQPLIVIRDDSGPRRGWTTYDRSVGVSVLAGSRVHDQPANDLARWVASIIHDDALPLVPDSPIAAVLWGGCNGPHAVPDALDVSRRYLTAHYVVTGSW